MSVGRICTRTVDIAEPKETAWQAAERMHQRSVGALVVVDSGSLPVGIVTDRDITIHVVAQSMDPHKILVRDIMTAEPVIVREETPIEDALSMMRSKHVRRLPVVDDQGKLAGLVTLDDVTMLLAEEMFKIGELLEQQTPRAAATPYG